MGNFKEKAHIYVNFIKDNFMLVAKDGQIKRFYDDINHWKIQEDFILNKATGKDVILKSRQLGFSSIILAIFTTDFLLKDNSYSMVIADKSDNAEDLLSRVKFYIKSFEEINQVKLNLKYNSKYELYNEHLNSTYKIGTAENKEVGRSKSLTGLHLCVGEETKIILSDGSTKKIKDIKIGDVVIAENGKPTKVLKKIYTGRKKVLKIKTYLSNEEIYVSEDHKIRVMGRSCCKKVGGPIWKLAKELTNKDYILWAYPKTGSFVKFLTVPRIKNCVHLPVNYVRNIANQKTNSFVLKTDYKLGYFFGYYLAEGNLHENKLTFSCHKNEEYYKYFIDLFPKKPVIEIKSDKTGTRKLIIYYSKEIVNFVNKWVGAVGNKHVPEKFLYQFPKSFLQGLYDGWKDGDGSKAKLKFKNISITTTHEKIARQMKQLYALLNHRLLALDFKENRYRYDKKTKPVYILREHGFDKNKNHSRGGSRQKYVVSRNAEPKNGFLFVRIKSIEEYKEMETYEIEVEDKSHAFLTVCGVISNSEYAYYQDPEAILRSALQAVVPEGKIFIETTANGFNFFKTFWEECKRGERPFNPLFYKASDFYSQEFLEQKKKELKEFYSQEYPNSDIDSFISSGQNYFDKLALKWYLDNIKEPIKNDLIYV